MSTKFTYKMRSGGKWDVRSGTRANKYLKKKNWQQNDECCVYERRTIKRVKYFNTFTIVAVVFRIVSVCFKNVKTIWLFESNLVFFIGLVLKLNAGISDTVIKTSLFVLY